MKLTRIIALVLLVSLCLTGCELPQIGETVDGTLNIAADSVLRIDLSNVSAGTNVVIQDRSVISEVVKLINRLVLTDEVVSPLPTVYDITLTYSDGSEAYVLSLLSDYVVIAGGKTYDADAEKLLAKAEKLECATLSDDELLRRVFEDDYWDTVTIKNEKGELSVDKILALPQQCPALFELLGRPTVLKTLGSSGIELLEEYAGSASEHLRQRAQKLGDILSTLLPDIKDKVSSVLKGFIR